MLKAKDGLQRYNLWPTDPAADDLRTNISNLQQVRASLVALKGDLLWSLFDNGDVLRSLNCFSLCSCRFSIYHASVHLRRSLPVFSLFAVGTFYSCTLLVARICHTDKITPSYFYSWSHIVNHHMLVAENSKCGQKTSDRSWLWSGPG